MVHGRALRIKQTWGWLYVYVQEYISSIYPQFRKRDIYFGESRDGVQLGRAGRDNKMSGKLIQLFLI